jgi:hypothetical protein
MPAFAGMTESLGLSGESKLLQHFLLQVLDLAAHAGDAVEWAAHALRFLHDLVDFSEDVLELGVKLDQGARPLLATLAGLNG